VNADGSPVLAEGRIEIAASGRTFGIDVIHVWRFELQDATTIASMEESFDGLVAKLFRFGLELGTWGKLQRRRTLGSSLLHRFP
jgi:hypothetical protein